MPISKWWRANRWDWVDAFYSFELSDKDAQSKAGIVGYILKQAGYEIWIDDLGIYTPVIAEIKKDGIDLIPKDANIGFDDPRYFLPSEIITFLDDLFSGKIPDTF